MQYKKKEQTYNQVVVRSSKRNDYRSTNERCQ